MSVWHHKSGTKHLLTGNKPMVSYTIKMMVCALTNIPVFFISAHLVVLGGGPYLCTFLYIIPVCITLQLLTQS